MSLLRLTQNALDDDRYRVGVALEGHGPRRTAKADFTFRLTAQDEADLRWYLEDYLQWPHEPAPTVAARVVERMEELGTGLFRSIFEADAKTREIWNAVSEALAVTRVEIATSVEEATSIPWELLREPNAETPVALLSESFVRGRPDTRGVNETTTDLVRILLVICRPDRQHDVPFRSVATRILKGLDGASRRSFELDVLRPPTFEALARRLRAARETDRPYHVLHFDGHGGYLQDDGRRKSKRGYLIFEDPDHPARQSSVNGQQLSRLLKRADVPVVVLNACRSAYAEPRHEPEDAEASADGESPEASRALGSLAQELMEGGVGGVVAMRYNVYVVTAARFIAGLYASLARGRPLGQAVTLGRKQLYEEPFREVVAEPLSLQDWQVPIVFEAEEIALFPQSEDESKLDVSLEAASTTTVDSLGPHLPRTPGAGFWGRDETLLALDRAFDDQNIVLLHAYAGSGKTATAAEFARWYSLTGGVEGPVLFTSFEYHTPLAKVLSQFGEVFGPLLERSGKRWLAIDNESARRQLAIQVLREVPVLWIWDNVEPVTGFPSGSESAWTAEEQEELVAFLRDCRGSRAKFLLTSRRDEEAWLRDLPARIRVPPMPLTERLQLARALAAKRGRKAEVMKDWRPLLEYSDGNPLALTVLVGQALRNGLAGEQAVRGFVDRLRDGEAVLDDVGGEMRSRSLETSLRYGFEHAFDEEERRLLALLYLFQRFVAVDVLMVMGGPEHPWSLPEVRGLSRDEGIALLDRAAEAGLLTNLGIGYYGIHPALPWFFRGLFDRFYGAKKEAALWAFVEAMGGVGGYYSDQYETGNRDVIDTLRTHEANLLQAYRWARVQGWWRQVLNPIQGLWQLYKHTGRQAERRRLVKEIVPYFVDSETEGPLPGREEGWGFVNDYRARMAREYRQWKEAERLQKVRVDWDRQRAVPVLELPRTSLDDSQRLLVRMLGVGLQGLGGIRRKLGREDCVGTLKEALELSESIGDRALAAACAFNLGHACKDMSALRDLRQAEHWYRRSLEVTDERDRLHRGRCLAQLGTVAFERLTEARKQERPKEELLRHLNEAVRFYHQALGHFPSDAVDDLAMAQNQLGVIYCSAGETDRGLVHFRDSIHHEEKQGDVYGASESRFNIALTLARSGRLQDAMEYARAALLGYESYGESAVDDIQQTHQLIELIKRNL